MCCFEKGTECSCVGVNKRERESLGERTSIKGRSFLRVKPY